MSAGLAGFTRKKNTPNCFTIRISENRRGSFAIVPQLAYEVVGRVDFAIFIPGLTHNFPLVIIECDGHEFHERTVEQASKDRKRDREFQKYGIPVLRFTGTDIVRTSAELAEEVAEFLDLHAAEKERRAFQDRGIDIKKAFKEGGSFIAPYPWPRIRSRLRTGGTGVRLTTHLVASEWLCGPWFDSRLRRKLCG